MDQIVFRHTAMSIFHILSVFFTYSIVWYVRAWQAISGEHTFMKKIRNVKGIPLCLKNNTDGTADDKTHFVSLNNMAAPNIIVPFLCSENVKCV